MEKAVCVKCGSNQISILAWVNANTHEFESTYDDSTCWCENCQEHTRIKYIKE